MYPEWMKWDDPDTQALVKSLNWTPERWRKFLLDTTFHEPPVPMREFLMSPDYADYRDSLWPNVQAILEEFDKFRYREAFLGLGKGSGKSSIGAIFLARSIYWLMNLRDPWRYYQLRKGTQLNVLNVSISGAQAQSVIFDSLVQIVENSRFFRGKFTKRVSQGHADLAFPSKKVRAISGHSGSTAWRGYAVYAGVADEAAWFVTKTNRDNAEEMVHVMQGSMKTRFPRSYKLLVISSLKSRNDYVCKSLTTLRKETVQKAGTPESIDRLRQELGLESA
jgi:hypothetical protein